jgi:D-apionolactonase
MTDHISVNMKRYGSYSALPERRTLHAGPVTAVLENADLRYIRFGDFQIVQRLYMAVRDQNWDTIEPEYSGLVIHDHGDSFRVDFEARNSGGGVEFVWTGVIDGAKDGTIRYTMSGAPRKRFLRNRIGFCVLHPMELAGTPVTVETPDGNLESAFPEKISPHQPFMDMTSMTHPAGPKGEVTIRFEGDLFENEDQRNWTDASYKTYSTPLRLPYPVEVTPADRIIQSVTISVSGEPTVARRSGPAADVMVDPGTLFPLPSIGFGAGDRPLPEGDELATLVALRPDHLWVDLDLGDEDWRDRLATAAANASAVGASLDLSVIGRGGESAWLDLSDEVSDRAFDVGRVFAFPPPDDPVTFPRGDLVTHSETIAEAKAAFAGTGILVGGGTRAYFTELNRGTNVVPFAELDALTYTINPQVHAVDNLSLIENIAAQAETVVSARSFAGDIPLVIGPITLKPRYNPNATGPAPEVGPDRLPDSVDPRQMSLLGAGWTIGSIRRLTAAGADALTYYELVGWRGLMEREDGLSRRELFPSIPGGLFPLCHVFAAIASFGDAKVVAATLADGLAVEALVMVNGDRVRVLVANLTNEERTIAMDVPGMTGGTFRVLDEVSYETAAADPSYLTATGSPLIGADITLPPFAIACVDGEQ